MTMPPDHVNTSEWGKAERKRTLSVLKDKPTTPARYMRIGRFALVKRQSLQVRTSTVMQ